MIKLKIAKIRDESPTLKSVTFSYCDPSQRFAFETGQYVKLSKEGKGGSYFAIASSPEDEQLEFLVRDQEKGFAHEVFSMKEGEEVASTAPMGKGFPRSALAGKSVTFIVSGSGVSPVASCIRSLIAKPGSCKEIRLFYGEKTPNDFAYKEELKGWDGQVKLFQVVSRPEDTGWKGLTGHVQDHLKGNVPGGAESVACLCGMKGMVEDATRILKELGVPAENIRLNF